jgi:hypothetical protein
VAWQPAGGLPAGARDAPPPTCRHCHGSERRP